MIDQEPSALRKVYFEAWQKSLANQPLSDMENIIVDIISRHPEYHALFSQKKNFQGALNENYALDHNPFFHLALHVTIAEQVGADKPTGVRELYFKLLNKCGCPTETEHLMMECLAKILVTSFQSNEAADEAHYLTALQALLT